MTPAIPVDHEELMYEIHHYLDGRDWVPRSAVIAYLRNGTLAHHSNSGFAGALIRALRIGVKRGLLEREYRAKSVIYLRAKEAS